MGTGGFFVLVAIVVLISVFELLDAVVQRDGKPPTSLALAGTLGLLLAAYFERYELLGPIMMVLLAATFFFTLLPGRSATPASDVAWTIFGVTWIGGGGVAAVSILMLPDGLALLVAFILLTAVGDIGAYFAGTRLGRRRIAPSISPGKSWEGFAGGALLALLAGAAAGVMVPGLEAPTGLGLAAVCALLAPVGDLSESLAKRELGIKDSGRLLPGHGGFLDRIDAIVFCAPAAYLYLWFVTA